MYTGSLILHGKSTELNIAAAQEIAIKNLGEKSRQYVLSNTYPDCLYIQAEDNNTDITIDKTRNILDFLSKKSEFNNGKIVIIDSAAKMNNNSANSILKIMEEPPKNSLIILTTTHLFSLLPTIRSRSLKIYVPAQQEYKYSSDDPFYQHCIKFLDSNMSDIPSFAKTITPEQKDTCLDIILNYAYCSFINSQSPHDADNYIKINNLINGSINTYLDHQTLIITCCTYLKTI